MNLKKNKEEILGDYPQVGHRGIQPVKYCGYSLTVGSPRSTAHLNDPQTLFLVYWKKLDRSKVLNSLREFESEWQVVLGGLKKFL